MKGQDTDLEGANQHPLTDMVPGLVAGSLTVYSILFVGDWIMTAGCVFFMILSLDWAVNREAIRDTTNRLQELADNAE